VIRGKKDKKKAVGDAEQKALINAQKDEEEGGEKVLASAQLPSIHPGQWHRLTLGFYGSSIKARVDEEEVLSATDSLYDQGMAGLLAGPQAAGKLSTPYYDNIMLRAVNGPPPPPASAAPGQSPLYRSAVQR
jgi:galactosylceramidase